MANHITVRDSYGNRNIRPMNPRLTCHLESIRRRFSEAYSFSQLIFQEHHAAATWYFFHPLYNIETRLAAEVFVTLLSLSRAIYLCMTLGQHSYHDFNDLRPIVPFSLLPDGLHVPVGLPPAALGSFSENGLFIGGTYAFVEYSFNTVTAILDESLYFLARLREKYWRDRRFFPVWDYLFPSVNEGEYPPSLTPDFDPHMPPVEFHHVNAMYHIMRNPSMQEHISRFYPYPPHIGLGSIFIYTTGPLVPPLSPSSLNPIQPEGNSNSSTLPNPPSNNDIPHLDLAPIPSPIHLNAEGNIGVLGGEGNRNQVYGPQVVNEAGTFPPHDGSVRPYSPRSSLGPVQVNVTSHLTFQSPQPYIHVPYAVCEQLPSYSESIQSEGTNSHTSYGVSDDDSSRFPASRATDDDICAQHCQHITCLLARLALEVNPNSFTDVRVVQLSSSDSNGGLTYDGVGYYSTGGSYYYSIESGRSE